MIPLTKEPEYVSEFYGRFTRLRKSLVESITTLTADHGVEDSHFTSKFLPLPKETTLSWYYRYGGERMVLDAAYICLSNDVVSITSFDKEERIILNNGSFDPDASFQNASFSCQAVVDLGDLCDIASMLEIKHLGTQKTSYDDFVDLRGDIIMNIHRICETRKGEISFHDETVQICVDRCLYPKINQIMLDKENIVIDCSFSGYSYFLVIFTPERERQIIAKYLQNDGDGNTADAMMNTTEMIRLMCMLEYK